MKERQESTFSSDYSNNQPKSLSDAEAKYHNQFDKDANTVDIKRIKHAAAEQKRRIAIKRGYDLLNDAIPTCQQSDPIINTRITKHLILQNAINFIDKLINESQELRNQRSVLERDVVSLDSMEKVYKNIFCSNQLSQSFASPSTTLDQSNEQDQKKTLHVQSNTIEELSFAIINWVERECNPEALDRIINRVCAEFSIGTEAAALDWIND
ncbi:hypothetical protein GJ496_001469 [Pomphorhynchus laevis]|nr:hypothetical protein GJ496_001469 [Pomphorhynchus laevis]